MSFKLDSPSNGEDQWSDFGIPSYKWFLFEMPWPVVTISSLYLLFTLKIGPALMKNREPFNLKYVMMIYNLYQFISNGYMAAMLFAHSGTASHMLKNYCHPMDISSNTFLEHEYTFLWLYLVSKVTDLLDTVFFILRHKKSHLTFLHVYHHASMVVATWYLIRHFPSDVEKLIIFGFNNTIVHTVMYFYYFLASLGSSFQKYLWWKVYVTRLQILQFIIGLIFIAHVAHAQCSVDKMFAWFLTLNTSFLLILFMNFYVQAYLSKGRISVKPTTSSTKTEKTS